MTDNNDIQLIENYLDGLLSGDELKTFEDRLNNDESFRVEFEQRKKLADLWRDAHEYQNTKQQIQNILKAEKRTIIHYLRDNYYLYGVAASFLILFGIYWFMIRQQDGGKPDFNNQWPTQPTR